ncbi:hypothetical protein DL93DRAFT_928738 [Clavulina sp. PMI_390]|nr:hypothetical protein DL93DRAFT_928738 [Clavulina sp. PMI_390]
MTGLKGSRYGIALNQVAPTVWKELIFHSGRRCRLLERIAKRKSGKRQISRELSGNEACEQGYWYGEGVGCHWGWIGRRGLASPFGTSHSKGEDVRHEEGPSDYQRNF